LATPHLKSQQWTLKETAALSVGGASKAIGRFLPVSIICFQSIAFKHTDVEHIGADLTESQSELLWPALLLSMSGKSWTGKEAVFDEFLSFNQNAPKAFVNAHQQEMTKVSKRRETLSFPLCIVISPLLLTIQVYKKRFQV